MSAFGVCLGLLLGYDYSPVETIALASEKVGYDSIWVSDHFFQFKKYECKNCMDAWMLLAALAAKTEKIRLGTLVTCYSYRYPAVLAKMTATVDGKWVSRYTNVWVSMAPPICFFSGSNAIIE